MNKTTNFKKFFRSFKRRKKNWNNLNVIMSKFSREIL